MMRSLLLWEMTGLWFFGIHFLARNAQRARHLAAKSQQGLPPLSRWWRMEKTIIEFPTNIFSSLFLTRFLFFQFWPRKKNYEQVLMTLKVKIIMGFKSVRHSVQLPSSTPKLKKHRERILPKNLGKKPFPWLAELKDPLLIFNQTTFHLRRYHLSKSNIPSNNDWKLVHRVRTFSGKLIILSYRLSKQR